MSWIAEQAWVPRPVEEVFAFLTDTANDALWQPGVVEASHAPPGPVAIGTRIRHTHALSGRRLSATFEVVDLEPPYRSHVRSLTAPVSFEASYTLSRHHDWTLVVLAARLRGTLGRSVLATAVRRELVAACDGLRHALSAAATDHAPQTALAER